MGGLAKLVGLSKKRSRRSRRSKRRGSKKGGMQALGYSEVGGLVGGRRRRHKKSRRGSRKSRRSRKSRKSRKSNKKGGSSAAAFVAPLLLASHLVFGKRMKKRSHRNKKRRSSK